VKIEAFPDAESAAREAAKGISEEAREAVPSRGKFVMAVSGGKTPRMSPGTACILSRWMLELRRPTIPIPRSWPWASSSRS
jgi:hypothetical protein